MSHIIRSLSLFNVFALLSIICIVTSSSFLRSIPPHSSSSFRTDTIISSLPSSLSRNDEQQISTTSRSDAIAATMHRQAVTTTTTNSLDPSNMAIVLNEDYDDVSANWDTSIDGSTAFFNKSIEDGYNVITNRISYCGPGLCYRSEYKTPQKQRTTLIPSVNAEYWLAFSNRLPADWVIPSAMSSYDFDMFQIHGGTTYPGLSPSPIFALRAENGNFAAYICGGQDVTIGDFSCQQHIMAPINTGTWNHWVIHSILTPGTNGTMQIWLNNTLVCDLDNLRTSYNDPDVPYLKFGAYQLSWKSPK